MKKIGVLILMLSGWFVVSNQGFGQQVINQKLVYSPYPNKCLSSQSEIFSFVVNKETKSLDYVENWKFSDTTCASKWMIKSTCHNLLPKMLQSTDSMTSIEISGIHGRSNKLRKNQIECAFN